MSPTKVRRKRDNPLCFCTISLKWFLPIYSSLSLSSLILYKWNNLLFNSIDAVEIEYDDRHTAEGLKEVKETTPKPNNAAGPNTNGKGQQTAEEDDEDDLDIDDI